MKATGKAIHFEIFVVVIALFVVSLIVNDGDDLKYLLWNAQLSDLGRAIDIKNQQLQRMDK